MKTTTRGYQSGTGAQKGLGESKRVDKWTEEISFIPLMISLCCLDHSIMPITFKNYYVSIAG